MKNTFILLAITLFTFSFSSCSDDESTPEPTVDIRDQIVGTYTSVATILYLDGSPAESESGTIKIEKGTVTDKIIFFEDGEIIANGTVGGVVFDLEDMSKTEDGVLYESKGVDEYTLTDGTKYHGGYNKDTNEIIFNIDIYADGTRIAKIEYVLTKI
jgi:hypothetical protein